MGSILFCCLNDEACTVEISGDSETISPAISTISVSSTLSGYTDSSGVIHSKIDFVKTRAALAAVAEHRGHYT